MKTIRILEALDGKWDDGNAPRDLFERHVSKQPEKYVGAILDGLAKSDKRVRNGCAELSSLVSAARPELLAPHASVYVGHLLSREPVLRWEAACTIGNLAAAMDAKVLLGEPLDVLVEMLGDTSIVLQSHVVRALGKIARAHPKTAPRILDALLRSRKFFPKNRVGHLIEAMETFSDDARASAFVEPFVSSPIASVASKAKRVLRRMA